MEHINFFILRIINFFEIFVNSHRIFMNYSKRWRIIVVTLQVAWTIGLLYYSITKLAISKLFALVTLLSWTFLMISAMAKSRQYVGLIETLKNITAHIECKPRALKTYFFVITFILLQITRMVNDIVIILLINFNSPLLFTLYIFASVGQMLMLSLCSQILIIFEMIFESQRVSVERVTAAALQGAASQGAALLHQLDTAVQSHIRALTAFETFSSILSGSVYCCGLVTFGFFIDYFRVRRQYLKVNDAGEADGLRGLLYCHLLGYSMLALVLVASEGAAAAAGRLRAELATLNYVIDEEGPLKTQVKLSLRLVTTFPPCFGSRSLLAIDASIVPVIVIQTITYAASGEHARRRVACLVLSLEGRARLTVVLRALVVAEIVISLAMLIVCYNASFKVLQMLKDIHRVTVVILCCLILLQAYVTKLYFTSGLRLFTWLLKLPQWPQALALCPFWMLLGVFIACNGFMVYFACDTTMKSLMKELSSSLRIGISQYLTEPMWKTLLDTIQVELSCCGIESFGDWHEIAWINLDFLNENSELVMKMAGADGKVQPQVIPYSCCTPSVLAACYHDPLQQPEWQSMGSLGAASLHARGCAEAVRRPLALTVAVLKYLKMLAFMLQVMIVVLCQLLRSSAVDALLRGDCHGPGRGHLFAHPFPSRGPARAAQSERGAGRRRRRRRAPPTYTSTYVS